MSLPSWANKSTELPAWAQGSTQPVDAAPTTPNNPIDYFNESMQAAQVGGFHAFDALATTMLKAGAKSGIIPGITPESVQSTYDQNSKVYNNAYNKYPAATTLGNIVGGALESVPLMYAPSLLGAGIGSIPAIGKLAANVASSATGMGLLGAATTTPGQDPNQILNPENAVTGALFGGAGAGIGALIGNTAEGANRLYQAQKTAPGMKIFSSDLPTNSVIGNAWKWVVNNALSKLPGWMGTQGGRDIQTQQAQALISKQLSTIAQDTKTSGPVKVMSILKAHTDELDQTEHTLWNNFTKQVPNEPVARSTSLPILKDILEDPNQVANLTTSKGGEIQALRQGLQANTPTKMKEFKSDVWNVISRLQNKVGRSASEDSLLSNAKQLYGANIDDLKRAISNNPEALKSYEAANQFTKTYRDTLGNLPQLQKALKDSQDEMGHVSDFVNWLKSKNTSSKEVQNATKILGKTGSTEVGGQMVQDAFNSAQATKNGKAVFNLDTFLNKVQTLESSAQAELAKPALEAIQGYTNVLKQIASSQGGGTLTHAAAGGGVLAGAATALMHANPVAAGVITATPAVLSWFAKNSLVKNAAIWANKALQGKNQPINEYMVDKVTKAMFNAGIIHELNSDGSSTVYQQETKQKKEKKPIGPTSLNDNAQERGIIPKGYIPPIKKG